MGIVRQFIAKGWTVVVATSRDQHSESLASLGAILEPINFSRGGARPVSDIIAALRLSAIIRKVNPSLIHCFNSKPIIFAGLALWILRDKDALFVNTITGLGHAFVHGGLLPYLAGIGYKMAARRACKIIFQNKDDKALFEQKGWCSTSQSVLIVSSGVDLEEFRFCERSSRDQSLLRVAMIGRLIWQKGIAEFVEVAQRITKDMKHVEFQLIGELDCVHPDAVPADYIGSQKAIKYMGRIDDIPSVLRDIDILLFPSYREGAPRVILEAAATGLPTVAFAVPGVSEVVDDKKTGYIVPFKDVDGLEKYVRRLLTDTGLRVSMGKNAREAVARRYDLKKVESAYFAVYQDLGMDVE